MDFEAINDSIGGCRLYQCIAFILLSLPTFKYAVDIQSLAIGLAPTKFYCITPNTNYTINEDQCSYKTNGSNEWIKCTNWIYDRNVLKSTFIIDFDLVCDRQIYRNFIFPLYFFSSLFRYPFSFFADKYGRRYYMLALISISILVTIWMIFIQTLYELFITVLISGFVTMSIVNTGIIILIELVPSKYLELGGANFWVLYPIGYICSSGFAYYSRSWRIMSGFSLMFTGFYVLYIWFIPESPRWLALHDRKDEAFKIFEFIGKVNCKKVSIEKFDKWQPKVDKESKLTDLFKSKKLFLRNLVVGFALFAFGISYNALSTDLTFAIQNIFLTILVMGIVEIPAGMLATMLSKTIGRKKGSLVLISLGIISLIIIPFLISDTEKSSWQPWLKLIISMLAKFGFTSTWCIYEVYRNELVPTSIRNSAVYISSFLTNLGLGAGNVIHTNLKGIHIVAPNFLYASLLIISMILMMLFLPETKGIPLFQTIDEADSLRVGHEKEYIDKLHSKSMQDVNNKNLENTSVI